MTISSTIKRLSVVTAGAALLTLEIGGGAQAAILGTEDFRGDGGVSGIFTGFQLTLRIAPNPPRQSGLGLRATLAPLFEGITITPADVGQTFTVTQTTDPDFNNFVALLTNGQPDFISLTLGGDLLGRSELTLGKGGGLFGDNPDLLGNTISSISFQLNSLILNTPGTDPNGDGAWTDYSFDGTLIVEGQAVAQPSQTVPEPTAGLSLLLFGVVGTGSLLKRQIKSNGLSRFSKQKLPD
jgi:hypothetical protein